LQALQLWSFIWEQQHDFESHEAVRCRYEFKQTGAGDRPRRVGAGYCPVLSMESFPCSAISQPPSGERAATARAHNRQESAPPPGELSRDSTSPPPPPS
jgi:hypothetical protein